MDPILDSAAGGRPNFLTTQWSLVVATSAQGDVANGLGLSLGAVKTVIHRLRGRYRVLLREEVARTVGVPAEVDEELRYLRRALRG